MKKGIKNEDLIISSDPLHILSGWAQLWEFCNPAGVQQTNKLFKNNDIVFS